MSNLCKGIDFAPGRLGNTKPCFSLTKFKDIYGRIFQEFKESIIHT